jgi:hypothetical protein
MQHTRVSTAKKPAPLPMAMIFVFFVLDSLAVGVGTIGEAVGAGARPIAACVVYRPNHVKRKKMKLRQD